MRKRRSISKFPTQDLYSSSIYNRYMATEMITLKLDGTFLKDIDAVVKNSGYQNRTEFIRNALREKVEESRLRQAITELSHLKGAAKRKTTQDEYERAREKAFEMISSKLR